MLNKSTIFNKDKYIGENDDEGTSKEIKRANKVIVNLAKSLGLNCEDAYDLESELSKY